LLDGWEDYEIRRLLREIEVSEEADAKPTELDEKELGLVKDQLKLIAAEGLRTACVDEFKHSQQVAASEWERARDRVLIVHDRTPLRELLDPGVGVFLTDELESRLRKLKPPFDSPREQFARINAALPPGERYQRIGAVAQPVPADVYRGPLDGLST